MSTPAEVDRLLIDRIRAGEARAWEELIARYEGRLLAFAESRLGRRQPSEDVVQETLIGFLNSLPNYDCRRSLESYLFSICAYKLTDLLRREGRRPTLLGSVRPDDGASEWQIPAPARGASSIIRSGERRSLEEKAIVQALQDQIGALRERQEWMKIHCLELLFVRGWPNKEIAERLVMSEQQVANLKFDFLARLRRSIRRQSDARETFPELFEEPD